MSVARAPGTDPRPSFVAEIGAIRQRLWLERAGVLVTRGLMLGFILTLALAVGGWAMNVTVPPLWYAVPLLVPLALAALASFMFYPSMLSAARIVDRRLELAEQLATASEIITEDSDELVAWAQVETAGEAAAWAQENWRGGPRLGRDLALTAIFGFLAAAALLLTGPEGRMLFPRTPAPLPQEASAQPAASPQAQPAASSKPQQSEQNAGAPQSQPTGRTAGVQRAVQEVRRSREAGAIDAGEAARRLGQAETELSRQTEQSRNDQQALDRLAEAMDQISAGHNAAEALQRGDYQEAAQAISELGTESDQLSQEAKDQLAQALRQAANDSAASPELSQAERRAADAMAGRDYEAAARAMADLADQVTTRSQNVIPQAELGQAWDQVNQERRAQGQPDSPAVPEANSSNRRGAASSQGNRRGSRDNPINRRTASRASGRPHPRAGRPASLSRPTSRLRAWTRKGNRSKLISSQIRSQVRAPATPRRRTAGRWMMLARISSSSSAAPGEVTSSAPPEINFVPSGRRDIVREYFQGPGEARPQP